MMEFFLACRKERKCLLQPIEAAQLMLALEAVSKIPGDIAEVGSFEGVSAKLLAATDRRRTLHIFDTFEGLPEPSGKDSAGFYSGQYRASEAEVKKYLQDFNVRVYKGFFPSTAGPITDKTFAFVHLDVDLYDSTKACLEFFYPRMALGGIILTHDYAARDEGVYRAFKDFFADKPEPVIELGGNQGMVVKLH
jgi:O-methyltransferase